jgi:acetyltransferase-like isoleucine patch superfamily enzyme
MNNTEQKQATSVHFELHDEKKSSFQKYKSLTVGEKGFFFLLLYDTITSLFGNFPGAAGYFFRKKFYKLLLKKVGKGVIWGRNVTLRHPHKIEIEDNVAINDFAVLDAYGGEASGIRIGEGTLVSRNTVLNSKGGFIEIGKRTNLGMMSIIFSRDCKVRVGNDVLMSAYCYIMGGGSHSMERTDIPISLQGAECKGIEIGDNVWLGSGVRVLDGCSIGRDSVIGTNSFVNTDIPEFAIAAGVPAQVVKMRK